MKYLYTFLILLLSNTLAYSQVNQSMSRCSGDVTNLTSVDFGLPDTTTYTWNYSIGAGTVSGFNSTSTSTKIFNQTLYVTGNVVGVVVYYITPSYGNPFTITINVNPTNMVVDASGIAPVICSGSNFNAIVSGVPNNTQFTWTVPVMTGVYGGVSKLTPQPYIVQPLTYNGTGGIPGNAVYTVTPIVGGCTNTSSFSFTVTVNPSGITAPSINNTSTFNNTPKCSQVTFPSYSATATGIAATNFSWVRPAQYGISNSSEFRNGDNRIQEALNDTLSTAVTVYYYYSIKYGTNCINTVVVPVTVNPIANITTKTVAACSGSNFKVNINDIIPNNTSYTWVTPSITGGAVTGAAAQSSLTPIIQLTLTNNPVNRTVPVTLTYQVSSWALTNGVNCRNPTPFLLTVTLNPVSTITQLTTTTCSNQPFNIATTSFPAGTNFTWSSAPTIAPTTSAISGGTNQTSPISVISQTLINNTNSAATATYDVIPITDKCIGPPFRSIVTVNPLPNIVNLNQTANVCSGSALNINQSGVPTNTTYTWSIPPSVHLTQLLGRLRKMDKPHLVKRLQILQSIQLQQIIP